MFLLKLKTFNFLSKSYKRAKIKSFIDFNYLVRVAKQSLYPHLYETGGNLYFFQEETLQMIMPNTQKEKKLNKWSLLPIFPHEVMKIEIQTIWGESFDSSIYHGKSNSVSSLFEIKNIIQEVVSKNNILSSSIKSIELLHTHPRLAAEIQIEDRDHILISGLSFRDIDTAKKLSVHFEKDITIKAITPHYHFSHTLEFAR